MNSLKKTLSLVLVLVMVLGMFGVASASSFTDCDIMNYEEAVDVMAGIGAVNGYADGSFKPAGTVTRAEAAKMVAYAVLGASTAAKLSGTASSFTDVDATNYAWAIPSIEYLVKIGAISGRGDGRFDPNGNVTAYEIGKMLLVALGIDGEYTGTGWTLDVHINANKAHIYDGSLAASYSAAATREECALYCFNTILYSPSGANSEQIWTITGIDGSGNITYGWVTVPTVAKDSIASTVYPTLVTAPDFIGGVSGYYWYYKSSPLTGFLSESTILATSTGTEYSGVYGLTTASSPYYIGYKPDASVTFYLNDEPASASYPVAAPGQATPAANLAANIASIQAFSQVNGAIVNFIDTDGDNMYDIVSITVKNIQQLAAAPSTVTSGAVTYVTIGSAVVSIPSDDVTYPSGLAKGDVILWYQVGGTGHYYVEKATTMTGTVSSYTAANVTIDGTKYYASDLGATVTLGSAYNSASNPTPNVAIATLQGHLGSAGYTYYLDNCGNICYFVAPDSAATTSNTFFLSAVQEDGPNFGAYTYKAIAVAPDGTQQTITVAKTAVYNGTMTAISGAGQIVTGSTALADGKLKAGLFYTYSANSNGTYNLKEVQHQAANLLDITKGSNNSALDAGDESWGVTGNRAAFLTKYVATAADWTSPTTTYEATPLATAGTVFMYYNSSTNTYTSVTGIANALTFKAGGSVYVMMNSTNTYAQVVLCTGSTTSTAASGYDQIFITSGKTTGLDASGNALYTYTAIVNGVIGQTVTSYQDALLRGTLYFAKEYAANGAIVDGGALTIAQATAGTQYSTMNTGTPGTATAGVKYAGGTISIDAASDASYLVSDSTVIYLCNGRANYAVSQITAEVAASITYDATNDTIFVVPSASSISTAAAIYIFID